LIGFRAEDASKVFDTALRTLDSVPASELLRHAIAPHAPYSVSPSLVGRIAGALRERPGVRTSIHLGESAAEDTFVRHGTGPFRDLLEDLGTWDPSWRAPGVSPVEYIAGLGLLDDRALVVHGVQFGPTDLARLAAGGTTLVTCPRGNLLTGAGAPPVAEFFGSGVQVAVGTDSLASVPDLNIFQELATLHRLAPKVLPRALLEGATVNGARALGFDGDFGALAAGRRDHLIAIETPSGVEDVEEFLVSGIDERQISWLPRTAR
jgi:cytosine/adenosine deaminase-related metal-dependent hydrolase